MNIKLYGSMIAALGALSGCATSAPKHDIAAVEVPTEQGSSDKVVGDASHLKGLPFTRGFIFDVAPQDASINNKVNQGSKKIAQIKPTGDTKPRAVVLLENKIIASSSWRKLDMRLNVRKKNIEICKGFMSLPSVEEVERAGETAGDPIKANRKNHVITYMPVKGTNLNNMPKKAADCNTFISNTYDYASAAEELAFILNGKPLGKSPYLVVYESEDSPYSSMMLSVGDLSSEAIIVLAKEWPEFIEKVYRYGDKVDPAVGIAVMLSQDERLQQAQKDAMWNKIQIVVSAGTCGGALVGSTVTLNTILTTSACTKFIKEAAEAMGYDVPNIPLRKA